MTFKYFFLTGLVFAALGLSAAADQYKLKTVEKTRSEIVNEIAEREQAKANAGRLAAIEKCENDDAKGCYELAEYYLKGIGGLQSYHKAFANYKIACEADLGEGCAGLAYMVSSGNGTTANQTRARALYEEACDLGNTTGCAGYGNMLFTGTGGRKQSIKGAKLLNAACEKKVPEATCRAPNLSDDEKQNCVAENKGADWACKRAFDLNARNDDGGTWDRLKDLRSRSW